MREERVGIGVNGADWAEEYRESEKVRRDGQI